MFVSNFIFFKLYHNIFLQAFLSHYFHHIYCHYCCRDYKWPLFHLRVKWSHSFFSLILKQDCMRLSRDVSSNQDRMTPAWPGDSSSALLFVSLISRAIDWGLRQSSFVLIEALQIPPGSEPSSQCNFQTRTWDIVSVLKFSFHRDNGKTPPTW